MIVSRNAGISQIAVLVLISGGCALLPASGAMAQFEMGISGGYFLPTESGADGGPTAQLRLGGGFSDSFRIAGELEYRKSRNELFGVDDVDIHGIGLHALLNYIFWPDAPVSPYAGVGLGLGVNIVDDDKIEDELEAELLRRPGVVAAEVDVTPIGLSVGVFGLLGLQVPIGDNVRLFAEGRYGGDWQLTGEVESETNSGISESDDVDVENLGGFSGIGGIRILF